MLFDEKQEKFLHEKLTPGQLKELKEYEHEEIEQWVLGIFEAFRENPSYSPVANSDIAFLFCVVQQEMAKRAELEAKQELFLKRIQLSIAQLRSTARVALGNLEQFVGFRECLACQFEAEWGNEECPHPVDPRAHSCVTSKRDASAAPKCGHSECRQHYIDTGSSECVRRDKKLSVTFHEMYGLDRTKLLEVLSEKEGITVEEARKRLDALIADWRKIYPQLDTTLKWFDEKKVAPVTVHTGRIQSLEPNILPRDEPLSKDPLDLGVDYSDIESRVLAGLGFVPPQELDVLVSELEHYAKEHKVVALDPRRSSMAKDVHTKVARDINEMVKRFRALLPKKEPSKG